MCEQQPSNPEVGIGACSLRDQRIRSLLDAVMLERVGVLRAVHQPRSNGFPKAALKALLRGLTDNSQEIERRIDADAGELTERRQSFGRQAIELGDHEIDHVIGVAFRLDATEVAKPSRI